MKISVCLLKKITYIYLAIPFYIFLTCWLNPVFAIISISALTAILYLVFKDIDTKEEFIIDKKYFKIIALICFLLCILVGIGGFYYQNVPDWNMKNAIFHDLINFSYPVIYDNNIPLVYYIGFMLPAAVIGKFAHFLGADDIMTFYIANICLFFYAFIGLFLVNLFICFLTKAKKNLTLIAVLIFIFFSGLDAILQHSHSYFLEPIEWHSNRSFSSTMTLLEFVPNQGIPTWIITSLFLCETKNLTNFGILGVLLFFFSPIPFIGLCFYFVIIALAEMLSKKKNIVEVLKNIFCIKNILSCCILIPILYFYFKSNNLVETTPFILNYPSFKMFAFLCCEAFVFVLIIWHRYYKNLLFYITIVVLTLCPIIDIPNNETHDFCMRASISSIFILMIFCIKFLFFDTSKEKPLFKYVKIYMIILLCVGSITPIIEFTRGFYKTYLQTDENLVKDKIKTLNNRINDDYIWVKDVGDYSFYGSLNKEKTIFWKYLARKK